MKKLSFVLLFVLMAGTLSAQNSDKLVILWTTAEQDVFTKVVYPYALNSVQNDWWTEVTLVVWGPSAKLLAGDEKLKKLIIDLQSSGVVMEACKWCADEYNVAPKLSAMGIDVKMMGKPLTDYLQSDKKVLVF